MSTRDPPNLFSNFQTSKKYILIFCGSLEVYLENLQRCEECEWITLAAKIGAWAEGGDILRNSVLFY